MSLLDDVSIVVTPNGYKAGELYAVIPVPTEGTEEINNGTFATADLSSFSVIFATQEIVSEELKTTLNTANGYGFTRVTFTAEIGKRYRILVSAKQGTSTGTQVKPQTGLTLIESSSTTGDWSFDGIGVATSTTCQFRLQVNGASGVYGLFDNVSVKELTSADMDVTRATDATRVNENGLIEDVLANVPRIDYTGGGCPHILAEPMRTNLVTYSEEISQYSDTNTTVIPDDTTSPDGTVNASKVTKDGANANDRVYINNFVILNATDYSLSVFIKNDDIVNGGVSTISARISGGTLFRQGYEWNGSTLSITSSQASGTRTNVLLEDYGNGWWKVGFSFTSDGTSADIEFDLDRINGTDTTAIFLWGTQLEVGSYPTSYIPNFGTALGVTRNQDIFTRDGIGSLINSTEGVLFVEMAALSNDGTNKRISLGDGTSSNRIVIGYNAVNEIQIFFAGTTGSFTPSYVIDITQDAKVAVSWSSTKAKFYVNGSPILETLGDFSFAADTLTELSFDNGIGTLTFFGKARQLQVYTTALSDPQLAALTS